MKLKECLSQRVKSAKEYEAAILELLSMTDRQLAIVGRHCLTPRYLHQCRTWARRCRCGVGRIVRAALRSQMVPTTPAA